ncbi:Endonuclease/exonuclease/phosphatase [Baffinella frigidus]|nr:Endonuclease/exonuclease/phosphatase [Cryptophyta sp. CCMP2293]
MYIPQNMPTRITDTTILDSRIIVPCMKEDESVKDKSLTQFENAPDKDKHFIVWAGTWNVSAPKATFKIKDMVHVDPSRYQVGMYAIALQEVTDPGAASMAFGPTSNAISWEQALDTYMDTIKFQRVALQSIGGTMLAVYIHPVFGRYISNISVSTVALGRYKLKNKGAVGIRFNIGKETFCIVSAHLAAGETKHVPYSKYLLGERSAYEKRVQNYETLQKMMAFKMREKNTFGNNQLGIQSKQNPILHIMDHSKIIFMGDLNFRITPNVSLVTLKARESRGDHYTDNTILEKLREYDELLYAMTYDKVLTDFQEGELAFKPTYKYEDNYDAQAVRMPAWTDRILWKGDQTKLLQYDTKHTIGSDHKPLHAIIDFDKIMGPS